MNKLSNVVEYTSEEKREEHKFSPDTIKDPSTLDLYKTETKNTESEYKPYNNFEKYSDVEETEKTKDAKVESFDTNSNEVKMHAILNEQEETDEVQSEPTEELTMEKDIPETKCPPCPPCKQVKCIKYTSYKQLFNISAIALLICILIITLMSSKK